MILHWEDGHSAELKVGKHLLGITHNGERPKTVEIDSEEVEQLLKMDERYIKDLSRCLKRLGGAING